MHSHLRAKKRTVAGTIVTADAPEPVRKRKKGDSGYTSDDDAFIKDEVSKTGAVKGTWDSIVANRDWGAYVVPTPLAIKVCLHTLHS